MNKKRKTILVYAISASSGGAETILRIFYDEFAKDINNYIIVSSVIELKPRDNIRIIRLPWVKKSSAHRIYCDTVYIKEIIRKIEKGKKIDEIFSLTNFALPLKGERDLAHIKQTVYVQNCIPFVNYKVNLLKDLRLWYSKYTVGFLSKQSLKRADNIVVQNEWMRKLLINQGYVNGENISVKRVVLPAVSDEEKKRINTSKVIFFYPAGASSYKNHAVIVRALLLLDRKYLDKIEVVFTISKTSNKNAKRLAKLTAENNLPIKFVGSLNKEEMQDYYRKSIVVFPSEMETVGLPLLEAKMYDCRILAADLEYARDTIGDYENSRYFAPEDVRELALLFMDDADMEC